MDPFVANLGDHDSGEQGMGCAVQHHALLTVLNRDARDDPIALGDMEHDARRSRATIQNRRSASANRNRLLRRAGMRTGGEIARIGGIRQPNRGARRRGCKHSDQGARCVHRDRGAGCRRARIGESRRVGR